MLDLETAFKNDNYQIFLRTEQEMPEELLQDCYQLFWQALVQKKYRVASFLMRKPFFKPFIAEKPKNWVSIVFNIPFLLQVAVDNHIDPKKIGDSDAIALIKSALKFKLTNTNGMKYFINSFCYERLTEQAKFQCSDLLGRLLCKGEWYWSGKLIRWGVGINAKAMTLWAKSGYGIPPQYSDCTRKAAWPHPEIYEYRKGFLQAIQSLGSSPAFNIVTNNQTTAFLFTLKLLHKKPEKKREFLLEIARVSFANPRSEFSNYIVENLPKLLLLTFKIDDDWAKKLVRKNSKITPIEQFILNNKCAEIKQYAVTYSGLANESCPKEILKSLKSLPKHIATLTLRRKLEELGVETIVPHITRKENLDMLLTKDTDPLVLMSFSNKPEHQAYLMEKLAAL